MSYLKSQEYGYLTPRLNDVVSRLTPYAAKKVIAEWNRKSSGASLSRATGSSCSCRFFCQLEMPCVHLLHDVDRGKLSPEELLKKCMWLNWGPVEPCAEATPRRHRQTVVLPPPRKRSATATDRHTLQRATLNRISADMAMMASARWERVHADLKVIWQIYASGKFIDLSSLVVLPSTSSRPAVPLTPIQPTAAILSKAPSSVISVS